MKLRVLLLCAILLAAERPALPQSAAEKNREGNRLYQQGAYEASEKAYLEAQAGAPARPELDYNLGNALLRQKKTDAALQSLRNAAARAERSLAASAWFNSGNALYQSGKFKEAADAFVESLRINPADRDAKHNLELALRKMNESQQQNPSSSQGGDQPPETKPPPGESPASPKPEDPSRDEGQGRSDPPPGKQPDDRQPRKDPTQAGSTRAQQRGGFSKERALQILDALENQELAEQRKRAVERQRRKATGKDW